MSDLGARVSCVGSFGHPNSTRLAAIGVLVRKAVCSRSDPRKAERPPTAWANWLKYRVASHLHQLSYANIKTLPRGQLSVEGAAVTVAADCVANRRNCSRRPDLWVRAYPRLVLSAVSPM